MRALLMTGLMAALLSASALVRAEDVDGNASSIVYGSDDRCDVYAYSEQRYRDIARQSVVALIPKANLVQDNGSIFVSSSVPRYGEANDLCEDERFYQYPTAAFCTGVLVDTDIVATAGHCIQNEEQCKTLVFAFDYYVAKKGELEEIRTGDLYECKKLLLDIDHNQPSDNDYTDVAYIQLSRAVDNQRVPATFRAPGANMVLNEPLWMIGTGGNIPLTIDDNARVYQINAQNHPAYKGNKQIYIANLDAFAGHSGSPVFDVVGRLSGLLVAGQGPDLAYDNSKACYRVNELADQSAGEIVQHMTMVTFGYCLAAAQLMRTPAICSDITDGLAPSDPVFAAAANPEIPGTCDDGGAESSGCSFGYSARSGSNGAWFMLALVAMLAVLRRRASSY